ncbi:hypothetical protein F4805DRAFT_419303 [Annulohypoxylon moriforme]|nr:hypothetical protein F4805DRAFT_419303 [Annulohypoxylon moriforme]
MCYQLIERYSACHCLYYKHDVDRCPAYGKSGHHITTRTILVGYACQRHASRSPILSRQEKLTAHELDNDKISLDNSAQRKSSNSTPHTHLQEINKDSENSEDPDTPSESESSESESSELWDNESVASISSISTVDPDVLAMIFQRLSVYGNLRWFWPKVINRSGSMKKRRHTVERFLRRYAQDLDNLARNSRSEENMTGRDRQIKIAASAFIRKSRLDLAERLCQSYSDLTFTSGPPVRRGIGYDFSLDEGEEEEEEEEEVEEEAEEEVEEAKEPNFAYILAEEFLFETEPIRNLELNVYTFLEHRKSELLPNTILRIARFYLNRVLSSFQNTNMLDGKRTISWKCKCGRTILDDYIELQPGALDRLQKLLDQYGATPGTAKPRDTDNGPNPPSNPRSFPGFQLWQQLKGSLQKNHKSHKLPYHRQGKGTGSKLSACFNQSVLGPTSHLFVLMCIPFQLYGTRLQQEDTCSIDSDREFFRALKNYYNVQRGRYDWKRTKRVTSINFVQFELFRNSLVDIKPGDSIPPPEQLNSNYMFERVDSFPPIGSNMLMHLFSNPEDADVLPILYQRIPKKMRLKLAACPIKGSAIGWGVRFVEGLDWFILFIYGCAGFALCLIMAVSWTVAKNDVQGGFTMAGVMVPICAFTVGYLQVALGKP